MSVFRCHECNRDVDSDFEGCEEHPNPERPFELICERCAVELEEAEA